MPAIHEGGGRAGASQLEAIYKSLAKQCNGVGFVGVYGRRLVIEVAEQDQAFGVLGNEIQDVAGLLDATIKGEIVKMGGKDGVGFAIDIDFRFEAGAGFILLVAVQCVVFLLDDGEPAKDSVSILAWIVGIVFDKGWAIGTVHREFVGENLGFIREHAFLAKIVIDFLHCNDVCDGIADNFGGSIEVPLVVCAYADVDVVGHYGKLAIGVGTANEKEGTEEKYTS